MELLIHEMSENERPRERLARLGASALSERELLALLLRSGPRGVSALALADEVLAHFRGRLSALASATAAELCTIRGIGPAKALELVGALELARRLAAETPERRPYVNSPMATADYMRGRFSRLDQEEFHVLLLDAKLQLLHEELVTLGLVDRSLAHAREVFRSAIRAGCSRVALCHNHPSGDPRPSPEDMRITAVLRAAGKIVDIEVVDHVIVGTIEGDPRHLGWYSFAVERKLEAFSRK